jgi:hypothetical protein
MTVQPYPASRGGVIRRPWIEIAAICNQTAHPSLRR